MRHLFLWRFRLNCSRCLPLHLSLFLRLLTRRSLFLFLYPDTSSLATRNLCPCLPTSSNLSLYLPTSRSPWLSRNGAHSGLCH